MPTEVISTQESGTFLGGLLFVQNVIETGESRPFRYHAYFEFFSLLHFDKHEGQGGAQIPLTVTSSCSRWAWQSTWIKAREVKILATPSTGTAFAPRPSTLWQ